MTKYNELVEKRNKLLIDARTLMNGQDVTTEVRGKVDTMIAEANGIKADMERMEATAESEQRAAAAGTPPRGQVEQGAKDERTFEERNKATNVAFRSFLKGQAFEQRDLTVSGQGNVMIPVAAVQPVQAEKSAGAIYDIVHKMKTDTGEAVKVPLWDDTANGMVLDSAPVTTNDPAVSGVTISIDGFRINPVLLDNKLIQDLDYDLVSDVRASFLKRYMRNISQMIVQGNGSNVLALSAPSALTTGTTGQIGYNDLLNLMTSLDPAYFPGAVFSFSTTTLGAILGIVDGNKRPIFLPFNDGATSGFVGTLFGFPVKIDQYAPGVASGQSPVRFGDHNAAYTLREVNPGVLIKTTDQRYIELNRLGVLGFARAGGAPTIASAAVPSLISLTVK